MSYPHHVHTDRLAMRRWQSEDRDAVLAIWADPDVWDGLRLGAPGRPDLLFAAERFEHHLRHWAEHGFGYWLAEDPESGEIAGWIGAAHPSYVPELSRAVEVGWSLRRPFWGRGLATEGAAAAIQACFAYLAEDDVIALIHPDNTRSIAVAERLGMSSGERAYHAAAECELQVYRLRRPGSPDRDADLSPRDLSPR
jgi:RimJ/RimL family protein N-acetyltransferase